MKKWLLIALFISKAGFGYQTQSPFDKKISSEGFVLHYQSGDKYATPIATYCKKAMELLPEFLHRNFKSTVDVFLFSQRKDLDRQWQAAWGMPDFKSQCWMVGSGILSRLDVLSPSVWPSQACEHDASDAVEIERLVIHELVHVLHSDHNRSPAFDQINNIDWFVEGLATYVSGQLDEERLTDLRKHLKESGGPAQLKDFWTGPHRYGQSGSVVAYIDQAYGRQLLSELMEFNDVNDMLRKMDLSEAQLIARWKEHVLK